MESCSPGIQTTHTRRQSPRRRCYLGRSNSAAGGFFDMKLDTFRIYDYVLTAGQAEQLYALTTSELSAVLRPLYDTAPLAQYSFDTAPDAEVLSAGTKFEWRRTELSHTGVALFNGVDEYVNLMTFPDDRGLSFPAFIGNTSLSFEAWVKFEQFRDYSRVFDFGNGVAGDNILLANQGWTPSLAFHVYPGVNGVSAQINTGVPVWRNHTWQHVVVVVEDVSRFASAAVRASAAAAHYRVYINGSHVANMSGYLPARKERTFSYLGQSNWPNALFTGSIDSFYFYGYALSAEQVNVRYLLPRFPVFDLSFSSDPRLMLPQYAPHTYAWQSFDPADNYANNALYHGGHLVLTGSRNPFSYVNLSTPVGPSSVGVLLPRIGGDSQGTGNTLPGWSFEFIVKIANNAPWAKLIDWGNGPDADNIIFTYRADTRQMEFQVINNAIGANWNIPVIPQVNFGEWYHLVVVAAPINVDAYTAVYYAYVDGELIRSSQGFLPQNVPRRSALIGRSNWEANGDGMFAGSIDAIRVYDYQLSELHIRALYALANGSNGSARPRPTFSSSSSSTAAPALRSSSSSSRRSSSSSAPVVRKRCNSQIAFGTWEPDCRCAWGGQYPDRCWCPNDLDGYAPWGCPDADPYAESSSTATAPPATASSALSTATVAAIVFAAIGVAALALYVYLHHFRRPATGDILGLGGGDGQQSLLHTSTDKLNDSTSGTGNGTATSGLDYYLSEQPVQPGQATTGIDGTAPHV